jgi:hypothetical protein
VRHYNRWRRHGDLNAGSHPDRCEVGPFVCVCDISRPGALGVCTFCGHRCVHRMEPHNRDRAIAQRPELARQIVLEGVLA